MTAELVLLTGATGHLGFRTLIETLDNGYRVRAAVRSTAKQDQVARAAQQYEKQLSFVIVPNIEVDGAFDEAVKGVDAVIHLASPLAKPSDDDEKNIIQPAIRGTLSILNSALREHSLKRVVITSSIAAVSPSSPRPFTADNVEPDPSGPYPITLAAYAASKKLAFNRARQWIEEKKPHFNVIHIMPSFVFGPNKLAKTRSEIASGSNGIVLGQVLGGQNGSLFTAGCHIDDVAVVHVKALKVEGNKNFGVNYTAEKYEWEDAKKIVKENYPKAVEEGVFKLDGTFQSEPSGFDASVTEKELGIKFKSYETAVKDLVEYYLQAGSASL